MNKLGCGFLRLPQTGTSGIDWPLLEAMVDEFLASGGKYFDTAYTYLDGMSEAALKWVVVERHPRANFQIADKLPGWKVKRQSDCQKYFSEQLDRCGVDYFDVYLLHWLNQANYVIAEQYDEFGFLNRLKAGRRIRKTGFSYHGDAAALEKILQAHPDVDVVQLQINYLDWDDPAMEAHKCCDVAARYGKEIMVCLLTMTSCSAAEIPAASGGTDLDSAKLTSVSQPASTFSDVPAGAWYAEAIAYCQQNGIMSGTSDTTFAPESTLTRAMLATVLHRISNTPAVSAPTVFTDAVAVSWYSDAVSWAAKTISSPAMAAEPSA